MAYVVISVMSPLSAVLENQVKPGFNLGGKRKPTLVIKH